MIDRLVHYAKVGPPRRLVLAGNRDRGRTSTANNDDQQPTMVQDSSALKAQISAVNMSCAMTRVGLPSGTMDDDEPFPVAAGEFWAQVAHARAASELSEAEFTRRVRGYGLDFRQENVKEIESGLRPMTLEEALVMGDILKIELPTSPGPLKAQWANASLILDLARAKKELGRIVERLDSLQKATLDLIEMITNVRIAYALELKSAKVTGDRELLAIAEKLAATLLSTKMALGRLQLELADDTSGVLSN